MAREKSRIPSEQLEPVLVAVIGILHSRYGTTRELLEHFGTLELIAIASGATHASMVMSNKMRELIEVLEYQEKKARGE